MSLRSQIAEPHAAGGGASGWPEQLDGPGSVLPLVEQAVAAAPTAVAIRDPDTTLTYGELSERADALAARLSDAGVAPGALVGLCVERSVALAVGALGILRAGAAYVAIDPAYPDARIRWMLDDAAAAAVVTDAKSAGALADHGAIPVTGVDIARSHARNSPEPTDPAYVVYTSGSTGRPKGVLIEHRSLANLVAWHRAAFNLTAGDRTTQIASPGFDAAVWELWPSLASGASIHVVPDALRTDPAGLRDWLLGEAITVSFVPTPLAEPMLAIAWPQRTPLRYLLTGGDALTRRPPGHLPFALVNNYGLSETTVVATSATVAPAETGPPPIGRPIRGVSAEVVDERLAPVPDGTAGELLLGGIALARGYLNRPELTDERFVAARYRTGDRVRRRSDGQLEFLGRLDEQVSIRGFRVEPGEIVAALTAHPAVAAGAVLASGEGSADRELVAYAVATAGPPPPRDELDTFLAGSLPDYMCPARYVWLERLPLTAHGKIDRDALAAATAPPPAASTPPARAKGETSVAEEIAATVAILLGVETVEPDENFFLIGGHSMLGAQLIARVEERYDVELSLRFLFDHPTPAAIATEVERRLTAGSVDG